MQNWQKGVLFGVAGLVALYWNTPDRASSANASNSIPTMYSAQNAELSKRAKDEISTALALSSDGARYSAAGLTSIVEHLVASGVSESTALSVVKSLVSSSTNPSDVGLLAAASILYAESSDRYAPSVADDFGRAFRGGAESVREVDKTFNFLTSNDLESMYALEKVGKFEDAKNIARKALSVRISKALQN